jgi:hypothetical protein
MELQRRTEFCQNVQSPDMRWFVMNASGGLWWAYGTVGGGTLYNVNTAVACAHNSWYGETQSKGEGNANVAPRKSMRKD